ncbi:MAG: hypothetical protein M1829_000407 [Trizodia sp. TS-e1964]|nr:MAG: hypothetical protein M1829_000407 [Trizodia sp. TS-e1964]
METLNLPKGNGVYTRMRKTVRRRMLEGERYNVLVDILGPAVLVLSTKHLKIDDTLGRISTAKWENLLARVQVSEDFQSLMLSHVKELPRLIFPHRQDIGPTPSLMAVHNSPIGHIEGEVFSQPPTPRASRAEMASEQE